jgi:hypothetical protein
LYAEVLSPNKSFSLLIISVATHQSNNNHTPKRLRKTISSCLFATFLQSDSKARVNNLINLHGVTLAFTSCPTSTNNYHVSSTSDINSSVFKLQTIRTQFIQTFQNSFVCVLFNTSLYHSTQYFIHVWITSSSSGSHSSNSTFSLVRVIPLPTSHLIITRILGCPFTISMAGMFPFFF